MIISLIWLRIYGMHIKGSYVYQENPVTKQAIKNCNKNQINNPDKEYTERLRCN